MLAGRLLGDRGSLPLHKVKRGATLLFCRFELGTKLGTVGGKKKRVIINRCII